MALGKQITHGLHWLASLFLVAACVYYVQDYSIPLIRELGLGTLVAIAGSVLILMMWKRRWQPRLDVTAASGGLMLIVLGLVITASVVRDLPSVVNVYTVYSFYLGPVYRVLHYAFVVYVVVWSLAGPPRSSKAEMGLIAIAVYSTLNGGLFRIEGERFALLYGLSLVTASMYLRERKQEETTRGLPPLALSILLFLLGGLLATAISLYAHNSLEQWLRLGNWGLVYFLIVSVVRGREQIERLLLAMLSMSIVVAIAGLIGVLGYASQVGWHNALRARLWVASMHSNGVATFALTCAILALGLFLAWSSRQRRLLLGIAIALLLLCTFLTYSRSAEMGLFFGLALIILLGKSDAALPAPKTAKRRLIGSLSLLLPLLFIVLTTLTRTEQNTLTSRLYIWRVVLNVIRHRPLLGVGLDNHFIAAFSSVLSQQELEAIDYLVGTHSHNLLLEISEGMGLLGMGLFLWLVVVAARHGLLAIRRTDDPYQRGLLTTLVAAGATLLVPHMLILSLSAATLLPISLWILLGLIVVAGRSDFLGAGAGKRKTRTEKKRKKRRAKDVAPKTAWRDLLLATLILVGVLLGVARPLAAAVAQRQGAEALRAGDVEKAKSAFRRAARLAPLSAEIQAVLGDMETGDEAVTAYRRATTLRPYYAPYHSQLGWSLWAQNQFGQATAEFERAVALDKYGIDGGEHLSDLGLAYAAAGKQKQAVSAFQEAVLLDPTAIGTPDWQATAMGVALDPAYARYQETQQVDEELNRRIAYHLGKPSVSPATFNSVGEPQIYLEDVIAGLLSELERGAAESDENRVKTILSSLTELHGQWEMEEELTQVLETIEENAGAEGFSESLIQALQGINYLEQGKLEEAQMALQGALQTSDIPKLHHLLGLTYTRQGMLEPGIAELEQAAHAWDPGKRTKAAWSLYWADLAQAYRRAGRLDEAIEAYEVVQFLGPPVASYLQLQLAIGEIYHEQGDYEREVDAYIHVVDVVSTEGQLGLQEQRLLQAAATRAAASYRRQGLTAGEAIAAHEALIESVGADERVVRAYLAFFGQAVER